MTDLESFISQYVKCCQCEHPMGDSALNFAMTDRLASWQCPVMELSKGRECVRQAMAVICDRCAQFGMLPRYAIEISPSFDEVTYHTLKSLPPMPQIYPEPFMDEIGVVLCPRCYKRCVLLQGDVPAGISICPSCKSSYQMGAAFIETVNVRRAIAALKKGTLCATN